MSYAQSSDASETDYFKLYLKRKKETKRYKITKKYTKHN